MGALKNDAEIEREEAARFRREAAEDVKAAAKERSAVDEERRAVQAAREAAERDVRPRSVSAGHRPTTALTPKARPPT